VGFLPRCGRRVFFEFDPLVRCIIVENGLRPNRQFLYLKFEDLAHYLEKIRFLCRIVSVNNIQQKSQTEIDLNFNRWTYKF
jgi:hypothetical protein